MDLLQHIISLLASEFDMKVLGDLSYFLGIIATQDAKGIFLSQHNYVMEILERANMLNCNLCLILIQTGLLKRS